MTTQYAWRFLPDNCSIVEHEWCDSPEFSASLDAWDALSVADGTRLCLLECTGDILYRSGRLCCSRHRIIRCVDMAELLASFARRSVLRVTHLWPAPAVAQHYLRSGDPQLQQLASRAVERLEKSHRHSPTTSLVISSAARVISPIGVSSYRSALLSIVSAIATDESDHATTWARTWNRVNSVFRHEWHGIVRDAFVTESAVFPEVARPSFMEILRRWLRRP